MSGNRNIRRVFVEKRPGFDIEAKRLKADIEGFLGVSYPRLRKLDLCRLLVRYDVDRLDEAQFNEVAALVLSEPQADEVIYAAGSAGIFAVGKNDHVFGIEYLPGQYDQRADSAEQCAELAVGIRPRVRAARIVVLRGSGINAESLDAIKSYLINPVDSREASLDMPKSLDETEAKPGDVPILNGFIKIYSGDKEALKRFASQYGLAMQADDLKCCLSYFAAQSRDPTLAELRVLDTYWSDHCRHTTFSTILEKIEIEEGPLAKELREALMLYENARREFYGSTLVSKHRTLMDIATLGAKVLKKRGLLLDLDESKEINACSIKVNAEFEDGSREPYLLLFKNETHNHPTEIEPFGGAATCLGGAIRDPLSGRAYVYGAMRVSGGGDPSMSPDETMPGKLPQLKIAREAAAGYASYGNQIGLATGQVAEFYHEGFLAKRMELGAVIGAVPAALVRREEPSPGDLVLLIGGKTGRDGIGGATGSSKVHTGESVKSSGSEVQKGNPVEERKLQRLFRNPDAAALIKRCNDFGAGGVSVAVGELAGGLEIDLDQVPKKYAGLDGIELAISESQERMAVVVERKDAEKMIQYAAEENLDAVIIAHVTEEQRLRMMWRGRIIVDIDRNFLDSNGALRNAQARICAKDNQAAPRYATHNVGQVQAGSALSHGNTARDNPALALLDGLKEELCGLRGGSRRGLQERFDGSIGAGSVLFPWGGRTQGTPEAGMAALLPSLNKDSLTASIMTFGYDPEIAAQSPYRGALGAVREALAKFACLGGDPFSARLSLQEYFERTDSPASWGKPLAALLGALEAQLKLGVPAIGGKDSMSGTYRDEDAGIRLTVPPTLVAFAAGTVSAKEVASGALSTEINNVILHFYLPDGNMSGGKDWSAAFKANLSVLAALRNSGYVRAAYPVAAGGLAVSLALMAFGNMSGIEVDGNIFPSPDSPSREYQGGFLAELDGAAFDDGRLDAMLSQDCSWEKTGRIIDKPVFRIKSAATLERETSPSSINVSASVGWKKPDEIPLKELRLAYESPLLKVYPQMSTVQAYPGQADAAIKAAVPSQAKPQREHSFTFLGGKPPLVVLPVFPGTNCEWDMERAFTKAGGRTRQIVFRNRDREDIRLSTQELAEAIREAQIVALSGGFSAGDEPDGSGKFIANVFRAPILADALTEFLDRRDGLVIGICNGFQALIKLGLVPYGAYRTAESVMPTLTFNTIGRHVSRMVRTKAMSRLSPWLALEEEGAIHSIPVSHGEGRLVISADEGKALFASGQAAFCYVDENGNPTMAEPDNPNGSAFALEGITSPDGRILGKMGHTERSGPCVHINIPGNKQQRLFEAGIRYFGN